MKIKILSLAVLASSYSIAQITINSTDFISIGDSHVEADASLSTTNDSPGANKTWNYSNLDTNYGTLSFQFLAPSATPKGSVFPTSNIAETTNPGRFRYLQKTSAGIDLVGGVSNSEELIYSDPYTLFHFPITYGSVHKDTFQGQSTTPGTGSPGSPDSIREKVYGVDSYTVDSWGKVTLPNGTFDALRLKDTVIELTTTEHFNSGVWSVNSTELDTLYFNLFLTNHASCKKELLIQELTKDGNVDFNYWCYSARNFVDISENKEINVRLFPNPTTDFLKIESDLTFFNFTITDISGKIVLTKKSNLLNSIDVTLLEPGNYVLIMSGEEGTTTMDFVKQ